MATGYDDFCFACGVVVCFRGVIGIAECFISDWFRPEIRRAWAAFQGRREHTPPADDEAREPKDREL